VLEPGDVSAGDAIEVVDRPDHGVTMADLLAARAGDHSLLPRLRGLALPPRWEEWLSSVV